MRAAGSGADRIDRCPSCGAAWFDAGEIRELAEGRFPAEVEVPFGGEALPKGREGVSARMARAWKKAASLACPRCSLPLFAADFQNTGVPVFRCRECGGILVQGDAVSDLARGFGIHRRNAALYEALGRSLAGETRRRLELRYGPDGQVRANVGAPGIPVVVPLADGGEAPGGPPVVTWGLLGMTVALHLLVMTGLAGADRFAARLALPAGAGLAHVPAFAPWLPLFSMAASVRSRRDACSSSSSGTTWRAGWGAAGSSPCILPAALPPGRRTSPWGMRGRPPPSGPPAR
jgi:Zn-finger nucleic acid-binding protein